MVDYDIPDLICSSWRSLDPGVAASGKKRVAFAAPSAGKILPMDLRQLGGTFICQKDAFLCAALGVALGIHFQQRLSVGFFGGDDD